MAFLDNPAIILAHIRQSHVTSDDTGMCEMVLIDHDVDLEKCLPSSVTGSAGSDTQGVDTQGCDLSQSVDITSSWDFGIRRRSNTAQRLERLRKERQNQIKCKNIQWKERNTSQSVEDMGALFEKKDFKDRPAGCGKPSTLSLRLEQCPQQLNNPFNEYSKFDGKVFPEGFHTSSGTVSVLTAAGNPSDPEMRKRTQNKHGFTPGLPHELMRSLFWERLRKRAMVIGGVTARAGTPARWKSVSRSGARSEFNPPVLFLSSLFISGPQYRLEKQSEPNVAVDLECTLERQSTLEFCLVRENSTRGEESSEEDPPIDITTVQDMLSSHHYKSFKISMIHKLRFTTDVQLGISGEKVEIDPVTNQKASTKFWIRQKPISIDSDLLCACDLVEEKSPSHAIFKLTYLSSHDYKPLYFESDAATINEIVLKVNYILESRASTSRADYFAQKQRKLSRRTSFSFQKEKKSGQQ
ncbi:target of rapamycin complex 2 subunit MAPKAP1-like [Polyodon spathula]|uniref:target of rapamycin complex 2 subunit MAPKAP1-like n=1 Tax=Polyodon spathula TaxID=7913 RepID=UPI001B7F0F75|nr:target of rapamycin complex 2 subunit MAPKAP1-like [Polyodon spathula]